MTDEYQALENPEEWFVCPHCGCEDVDVNNIQATNDLRPTVDCSNCPADGFLAPYTPVEP